MAKPWDNKQEHREPDPMGPEDLPHQEPGHADPPPPQPRQPARGVALNPGNRFEKLDMPPDPEWLESERLSGEQGWTRRTECFVDASRSVLSRNDSPDLGFNWSVNPYRGCEHGCSYCYARPSHEFLGLSAGLDFESRIMVKPDAPALLEARLRSPRWRPEPILLSGNTDCYQPVERRLKITRGCLEVCLKLRHPLDLITKNALILRDLDLLEALAARNLVRVTISVTSLDAALAAAMEPRASTPARRLDAIAALSAAGVPVGVNSAPIIPGLNDHEMPAILAAAADHGATWAGYIMLRLPHGVKDLFSHWLETHFPDRKARVLDAIRSVRGGALSDARFGHRIRGEGKRAEAVRDLFHLTCRRHGLEGAPPPSDARQFDPGRIKDSPQQDLFPSTEQS